jgi:hypothetical protein
MGGHYAIPFLATGRQVNDVVTPLNRRWLAIPKSLQTFERNSHGSQPLATLGLSIRHAMFV